MPHTVFVGVYRRKPIVRWEYDARDPHRRFQITLGKFKDLTMLPAGYSDVVWWVYATTSDTDELVFATWGDARIGFAREARRLQTLAGSPGKWVQLPPIV